jgi:bifunctional non-homologous end joining protein LigD
VPLVIPDNCDRAVIRVDSHEVTLTNLRKPFWPDLGLTKRDLLQYYADVSSWLLPHLRHRAMVMKRYPNGAHGDFFYMKRAPQGRPQWIEVCSIQHRRGNVIDFPMAQDVSSLLWLINLGCIDLHPWYAPCHNHNRPDFVNFDLDPVVGADFEQVRTAAISVRELLAEMRLPSYAKTSGSCGIHVYVPITPWGTQKQIWALAKAIALELEARHPHLVTAEYRVAKRPRGRVLVDYNQNAWGRTLASVYSVRPTRLATMSMPVTWAELERGIRIEDFRLENAAVRLQAVGDLWKPLLDKQRADLRGLIHRDPDAPDDSERHSSRARRPLARRQTARRSPTSKPLLQKSRHISSDVRPKSPLS